MTIYNWEKTNKCCVDKGFTKVSEIMDISRSTISHHFKELENAGLLLCSKKGQSCSCEVNKEILKEIKEFLK